MVFLIYERVNLMKMHLTLEDLEQLNGSQKIMLSELWRPAKYDIAVASICMNAETEEYDTFEFVIGNILIDHHTHILLTDIKALENDTNKALPDSEVEENIPYFYKDNPITGSSLTPDSMAPLDYTLKGLEAPFAEEESDENAEGIEDLELELDAEYTRSTCFSKEDCIPLFNIGQMIELLQRKNFGGGDFYLTASTTEIGCELGKNNSSWDNLDNDYESKELCDVLWELVKSIL
jgi:hypothetical protein